MYQKRVVKIFFFILLVIGGAYILWHKSKTVDNSPVEFSIDYSPVKFAIEEKHPYHAQIKNISFILEAQAQQDFPSKLMVYYLLPNAIKTEEVVELASKLLQRPLNRDELFRFYYKKDYEIKENGTYFWAKEDGFFSFMLDKFHGYTERIPKNLPDDQEAKSLAEGYLKYLGVWEEGLVLKELRTHKVDIKGMKSIPVVKMLSYSKTVDGYQIYYGHISIDIIDLGRICSVSNRLRKYQPFKEHYLKSVTAAFQDIPEASFIRINPTAQVAKINSVELGYFQGHLLGKYQFLHPVYLFRGIAYLNDGKEEPFEAYVSAVDEEKLSMLSKKSLDGR